VDKLILNLIDRGQSFDHALALVGSELPTLATPVGAALASLVDWQGMPSPGALVLSLVTEFASEQRRMNAEAKWQQSEAIYASMKDEASEMRDAAVTQLVMGVVSGALQIGMGFVQIGMGTLAVKNAVKAGEAAKDGFLKEVGAKAESQALSQNMSPAEATAAATKAMEDASLEGMKFYNDAFTSSMAQSNSLINALGQVAGGVGKIIDSSAQYVNAQSQADLKEMEADQEKMRAMRDAIQTLSDALTALIQQSLSAQNEIQSTTNQARTHILA
jgi:hypothetical protein